MPRNPPSPEGSPSAAPGDLTETVRALLRCPLTGRALEVRQAARGWVLETPDGAVRYPVEDGIPVLLPARAEPRGHAPRPDAGASL